MENKVKTIKIFLKECERIKPISKEDFNRRCNAENCCLAEVVMRNTYITSWADILRKCDLQRYEKSIPQLITELEVIVLDDNFEEMYRYIV